MNDSHPGQPPQGQGWPPPHPNAGWPPPQGQHPQGQQTWAAPTGGPPLGPPGFPPQGGPALPPGPPKRSNTGRTLLFLGLGLVLVIAVIATVALVVRGDDKGDSGAAGNSDPKGGGARKESCQTYVDLALNSEIWSATDLDPDKLQEMYDAVLGEITDDKVHDLVAEESEVVVGYYSDLADWKQQMMDALGKGETPDTELPADLTAQQPEIGKAQRAVLDACKEFLPPAPDGPIPSITAPTLDIPDWMKD